jgi:hypothetical protein
MRYAGVESSVAREIRVGCQCCMRTVSGNDRFIRRQFDGSVIRYWLGRTAWREQRTQGRRVRCSIAAVAAAHIVLKRQSSASDDRLS